MLWEVDIYPADGQPDLIAGRIVRSAAELGIAEELSVRSARGYLIQGDLDRQQVTRIADELLSDRVVEHTVVAPVGDAALIRCPDAHGRLIHVLPKPGVMDPVAQSALAAMADLQQGTSGRSPEAVRTLKKYWIGDLPDDRIELLCSKVLANDAIEQAIVGELDFRQLDVGSPYEFELNVVPIRDMDDAFL